MDTWTTLWASWVVEQAFPARLGQAVSLSTLPGEPFHRHTSFFVSISNQLFICSDTRYMTSSGPCSVFGGLVPLLRRQFPLIGTDGHSFRLN